MCAINVDLVLLPLVSQSIKLTLPVICLTNKVDIKKKDCFNFNMGRILICIVGYCYIINETYWKFSKISFNQ